MRILIPLVLLLLVVGTVDSQIFRSAKEVTALTGSPASDFAATITGDELTIYWHSSRTGGAGSGDIWMSTRKSISSAWTTPVNVKELNTTANEYYVTVRPDNLEIIFSRYIGTTTRNDLYSSTRAKTTDPWGAPVPLTVLNTANYEDDPNFRGDGLELFFSSSRTGQSQLTGLWHTTRKSLTSPWSTASLVKELDTANDDHSPAISGDGLTLFFSIYNHPGGTGSSDFFRATRPDVNSPFGKFVEIKELNSRRWEHNGCQTLDGFSFYYTYDQQNKIYRADRILPVCYAPGGPPVRGQTFVIYCRHDPGNVAGVVVGSLSSIPPTPVPPIQGNLEINLGLMFWWFQGGVDADGKCTTKIPVPDAPALKGITVFFQGAIQASATAWMLSPASKQTVQ